MLRLHIQEFDGRNSEGDALTDNSDPIKVEYNDCPGLDDFLRICGKVTHTSSTMYMIFVTDKREHKEDYEWDSDDDENEQLTKVFYLHGLPLNTDIFGKLSGNNKNSSDKAVPNRNEVLPSNDPMLIAKRYKFLSEEATDDDERWNWLFQINGFRIIDVESDGNCGYHSSALGLMHLNKLPITGHIKPALRLREALHSSMKRYRRKDLLKTSLCKELWEEWKTFRSWINRTWNQKNKFFLTPSC